MAHQWWKIADLLREASSRLSRVHHADSDADRDLGWYIAVLYVERARSRWEAEIRRPFRPRTTMK